MAKAKAKAKAKANSTDPQVAAGPIDADCCSVSVEGVLRVRARVAAAFKFQARDSEAKDIRIGGDAVTLVLEGEGGPIPGLANDLRNGQ